MNDVAVGDYELVRTINDMKVHLIRGGVRLTSVTEQELAKARLYGDTQEMAFARAVAMRRIGQLGITAVD